LLDKKEILEKRGTGEDKLEMIWNGKVFYTTALLSEPCSLGDLLKVLLPAGGSGAGHKARATFTCFLPAGFPGGRS
jgi:hypothetical protein